MGSEKNLPKNFNNLLFPKIFQTFRMAIQPSKLIITFAALAIISLTGWLMDRSKTVVAVPKTQGQTTELQKYVTNPQTVKPFIENYKERGDRKGVFSTLWKFGSEKFHGALKSLFAFDFTSVMINISDSFKALKWALRYHYIYSIIFFAAVLAVASIAGGSLCRIAALQLARGEKPGMVEALRFSARRFLSLFTTPLLPICIIIFIGFFIFLLGVIGNIPIIGELIMGIFTLLALVAGTLIATVMIGTVAGFNLMFPAIAYDGSDCFDAISRSFSYIYSKPWQMGFYTAIAAVYGAICYLFVRFFIFLLLWITHWFLQLGVWTDNSSNEVNKLAAIWPTPTFTGLRGVQSWATVNWSESTAAFLIYLVLLIAVGSLVSFVISFYFSANTIIYALMRNKVDNTALDDIYTLASDTESEPFAAESETEPSQ